VKNFSINSIAKIFTLEKSYMILAKIGLSRGQDLFWSLESHESLKSIHHFDRSQTDRRNVHFNPLIIRDRKKRPSCFFLCQDNRLFGDAIRNFFWPCYLRVKDTLKVNKKNRLWLCHRHYQLQLIKHPVHIYVYIHEENKLLEITFKLLSLRLYEK